MNKGIELRKKVIETPTSTIFWEDEEHGILHVISRPGENLTIENVKKTFEIYELEFKHTNRTLLSDISNRTGVSKEVRTFIMGPNGVFNHFKAIALLDTTQKSAAAMIASTLLKITYFHKPLKIFNNKQNAIEWLKTFQ